MTVIRMGDAEWHALEAHLLPHPHHVEQAAFLFATFSVEDGVASFLVADTWHLQAADLELQLEYHLSLKDETRAQAIKRAHDLSACLIEAHSHVGDLPAAFSWSDRAGLEDFVPHVRWRLQGRPYAALVLAADGFDGWAWTGTDSVPEQLDQIVTPSTRLVANKSSLSTNGSYPYGSI